MTSGCLVFFIMSTLLKCVLTCNGGGGGSSNEEQHLQWNIEWMQGTLNEVTSSSKVLLNMQRMLASQNSEQLQKFLMISDKLTPLGDLSSEDFKVKLETLIATWHDFQATTDQQVQQFAVKEGLIGKTIEEIQAEKEQQFDRIKRFLGDLTSDVANHKTSLLAHINKVVNENVVLAKRSEQLSEAMKLISSKASEISATQQAEIARLKRISNDRLQKLATDSEKIRDYVENEQKQATDQLLEKAQELRSTLVNSLQKINSRLDEVAEGQQALELIIKYSRSINRIRYLQNWWLRAKIGDGGLDDVSMTNSEISQKWAEAVLYGKPSDRPIEHILATLQALVVGSSGVDVGLIGSDNNVTLLESVLGNIREQVQGLQLKILHSDSERETFLATNSNHHDGKTVCQSEHWLLETFADELRALQEAAFAMAIKARLILQPLRSNNAGSSSKLVPINTRLRRGANSTTRPKINKKRPAIRFRNVSSILKTINETYEAQTAAYRKVIAKSSASVRTYVPLVIRRGGQQQQDTEMRDFLIKSSPGHLLRQLYVEPSFFLKKTGKPDAPRLMLTGCRFCSAEKCSVGSDYRAVVTQCTFKPFGDSKKADELAIFPSTADDEVEAASHAAPMQLIRNSGSLASGVEVKVITGVNRVNNPAEQAVCGIMVKKLAAFDQAFGIVIDVCSRNNGSFLYAKEPSSSMKVRQISQFNALWVRQTGGSTSGVGFYISADMSQDDWSQEKVLGIELESVQ